MFAGLHVLSDGATVANRASLAAVPPLASAREALKTRGGGNDFDIMFAGLSALTEGATSASGPRPAAPASATAAARAPAVTHTIPAAVRVSGGSELDAMFSGLSFLTDGAVDTDAKKKATSAPLTTVTDAENEMDVMFAGLLALTDGAAVPSTFRAPTLAASYAVAPPIDNAAAAVFAAPSAFAAAAAVSPARARAPANDLDAMFAGLSALTDGAATVTPVERSASPEPARSCCAPDTPPQQTALVTFPAPASPAVAPPRSLLPAVAAPEAAPAMRRGASSNSLLLLPPPDKLNSIPSQQAVEYPLPPGLRPHEWHHDSRSPVRARFLSEGHPRVPNLPSLGGRARAFGSGGGWGSGGSRPESGEFAHAHFKFREALGQSQGMNRKGSGDESVCCVVLSIARFLTCG